MRRKTAPVPDVNILVHEKEKTGGVEAAIDGGFRRWRRTEGLWDSSRAENLSNVA